MRSRPNLGTGFEPGALVDVLFNREEALDDEWVQFNMQEFGLGGWGGRISGSGWRILIVCRGLILRWGIDFFSCVHFMNTTFSHLRIFTFSHLRIIASSH